MKTDPEDGLVVSTTGYGTLQAFDSVSAESNSLSDSLADFDVSSLAAVDHGIWFDETVVHSYSTVPDSIMSDIMRRHDAFEDPRTPPPVPIRAPENLRPPPPVPTEHQDSPPTLPPPPMGEFEPAYTIIRKLRYEVQGKLFLVKYNRTGELYIIKQIPMKECSSGKLLMPTEADVLSNGLKTNHPNILHMAGYWETPETSIANVVYEYCSAGDVANVIEAFQDRPGDRVHPMFILRFVVGMVQALTFLHDGKKVSFEKSVATTTHVPEQGPHLHQDIKPGNVFLRWSENPKFGMPDIVLGDFGFARADDEDNMGARGTPGYWPPEVAEQSMLQREDKRYCELPVWSKAGDMYSFGVSLYELITLRGYRRSADIVTAVMDSRLVEYPEAATAIADLLEQCLDPEAFYRPRAHSCLIWCAHFEHMMHQWYAEGGRISPGTFPDPFYHDDSIQTLASDFAWARPRQSKPPTWLSTLPDSLVVTKQRAQGRTDYSVQNPYTQSPRSLLDGSSLAASTGQSMSPYQLSTNSGSLVRQTGPQSIEEGRLERALNIQAGQDVLAQENLIQPEAERSFESSCKEDKSECAQSAPSWI